VPTKKNNGEWGSIFEKEGETNAKSNINASKFKISNLQTKHKHFERELKLSLILDFVQCNSKSHLPHPNVNKNP
jgi:hypothetical protein